MTPEQIAMTQPVEEPEPQPDPPKVAKRARRLGEDRAKHLDEDRAVHPSSDR